MRKILLSLLGVVTFIISVFVLVFYFIVQQPTPKGKIGIEAEQLSLKISKAIKLKNFEKISYLSFTFQDVEHFHDYKNSIVKVKWSSKEKKDKEYFVVYHTDPSQFESNSDVVEEITTPPLKMYETYENKILLKGDKSLDILKYAQNLHANALFWFNPFIVLNSKNVEKYYVQSRAILYNINLEKDKLYEENIKVNFNETWFMKNILHQNNKGKYLIITDKDGLPIKVRIWSDLIIIQGLEFSFEDWLTDFCGSRISLKRQNPMFELNFENVNCSKS